MSYSPKSNIRQGGIDEDIVNISSDNVYRVFDFNGNIKRKFVSSFPTLAVSNNEYYVY